MTGDLLLVGASTRAAAHSALRGGLRPICVDQFGDVDLRSAADVVTVADWPAGLPAAIEQLPPCPWMYTGGLENHPRLVARISETRPLLGIGPDSLALVRDPWWLEASLSTAGLPMLEVVPQGQMPSRDGMWMRKPLAGAGGRGICVWDGSTDATAEVAEPVWYQRRVAGLPYSALFLSQSGGTSLLGITRQLVGLRGASAPPFAWCGALTPARLPDPIVETMHSFGETLATAARLRGLFGCDFILDDRALWLTEVNPRYTAAMELLDHQHRASLIGWHAAAFGVRNSEPEKFGARNAECETTVSSFSTPHSALGAPNSNSLRTFGKLVLFADCDLIARDATALLRPPCDDRLPFVADLPVPGQPISAGQPICSLFTYERNEETCLTRLLQCARQFRRRYLSVPGLPQDRHDGRGTDLER
jgi:predicted ATP-grasp superfamily ATP-dependent carboligase